MPTLQLMARVCVQGAIVRGKDRLQRTAHRSDAIGSIVRVIADTGQGARQIFQLCVLVIETNARG